MSIQNFGTIRIFVLGFPLGVVTLALGSRPRQRGYKSAGQEKARESHHILLGV